MPNKVEETVCVQDELLDCELEIVSGGFIGVILSGGGEE